VARGKETTCCAVMAEKADPMNGWTRLHIPWAFARMMSLHSSRAPRHAKLHRRRRGRWGTTITREANAPQIMPQCIRFCEISTQQEVRTARTVTASFAEELAESLEQETTRATGKNTDARCGLLRQRRPEPERRRRHTGEYEEKQERGTGYYNHLPRSSRQTSTAHTDQA